MNVSRQFTFLLATAGIAISVNIAAAQQALRVAINASGLPFSGFNSDTKTAEGATVEVISAVAQDAGLSISFVPLNFAAFGPSLEAKSVDVVAATTFGPTPERLKIADFTRAYATFRDAAVVSANDNRPYAKFDEFKGLKVLAARGTIFENALRGVGANVSAVDTLTTVITEVEHGNADALMWNRPEASRAVRDHSGLKVVDSYPPIFVGEIAFAIPKGNEALVSKLDASLAKLISNGTVGSIVAKWGISPKT